MARIAQAIPGHLTSRPQMAYLAVELTFSREFVRDPAYVQLIKTEFESLVDRTLERLELSASKGGGLAPFHEALVPKIGRAWAKFERSFSTSLGQTVIERVSMLAALAGGAEEASLQRETTCVVDSNVAAAIEDHIVGLRSKNKEHRPNWENDLKRILGVVRSGRNSEVRVISDLWFRRGGTDHFISIKTVTPNIDQTAQAKRDMLHLVASDPGCRVYFGLYYNPDGAERKDYSFSPPSSVFDMQNDPVVLIGKDYWDFLGGSGTMEEIISIAQNSGNYTKGRIADWADRLNQ